MYKFKTGSKRFEPWMSTTLDRPNADDDPPLTGWVNGYKASDIEERFARGCRDNQVDFGFKVRLAVLSSLIGDKKEIDFIIYLPVPQTVDVDGEFAHKTSEQTGEDQLRDALLNNELIELHYQIPHLRVPWYKLSDQDKADETIRRIVTGAYL